MTLPPGRIGNRCYALSQFRHRRPVPVGDPGLWYCAFGSSKVSPGKGTTTGGPPRCCSCCARFARLPKGQKLISGGASSGR